MQVRRSIGGFLLLAVALVLVIAGWRQAKGTDGLMLWSGNADGVHGLSVEQAGTYYLVVPSGASLPNVNTTKLSKVGASDLPGAREPGRVIATAEGEWTTWLRYTLAKGSYVLQFAPSVGTVSSLALVKESAGVSWLHLILVLGVSGLVALAGGVGLLRALETEGKGKG